MTVPVECSEEPRQRLLSVGLIEPLLVEAETDLTPAHSLQRTADVLLPLA